MKARRCKYCKRRFEPNAPKHEYCKGLCRVRAFRQRKKAA